ncbi:MAG: HEAT repeat domain-containing protein [Myxococcales bacterium]|nr:HEAT repeat domain-containing protein [Myxococcales bacterium]
MSRPFHALIALVALSMAGGCRSSDGEVASIAAEEGVTSEYGQIPPSLANALERTHSNLAEERISGIEGLGSPPDPRAFDRLSELLSDGQTDVMCEAAEALSAIESTRVEAEPLLLAASLEEGGRRQSCLLSALAVVGGDLAVDGLSAALNDAEGSESINLIRTLGQIGRVSSAGPVIELLQASDEAVRAAAFEATMSLGPGTQDQVRPLLSSDDPAIRCLATRLLAEWESEADRDQFRRLARHDSNPQVVLCALGALGRLGDTDAVDDLVEALYADTAREQRLAAEGLALARTRVAIEALIRALTHFHDDSTENAAQLALVQIGASALPALREALPNGPPLRRALLAETLGLLNDRTAIPALEQAAMDNDPMVRRAANAALEYMQGQDR